MCSISIEFKVHHYQLPCRITDFILKNFDFFFLFLESEQHFAEVGVTNISVLAFLNWMSVGIWGCSETGNLCQLVSNVVTSRLQTTIAQNHVDRLLLVVDKFILGISVHYKKSSLPDCDVEFHIDCLKFRHNPLIQSKVFSQSCLCFLQHLFSESLCSFLCFFEPILGVFHVLLNYLYPLT